MIKHPAYGFVENVRRIIDQVIEPYLPAFSQAVVASVTIEDNSIYVNVRRVSESTPDNLHYRILGSYVPRPGDTVLCARFGGTLVVLGRIVAARSDPYFISGELTGNQAVAHGLGVSPRWVFIALSGGPAGYTQPTITETHDATNVNVTATTGWKYRVIAWV